ncbi:MAG TPA: hypothetical protein VH639_08950 [Bryobacteraceae bacterium]|jgi:hypothetical protein
MDGASAVEPVSSVCPERERLERSLLVANLDYTRAAATLEERSGVMKKDDYRRIRQYVDQARDRAEASRLALERHTSMHGCGSGSTNAY